MPTVIPFVKKEVAAAPSQDSPMTGLIREELRQLSSNDFMVDSILERMKPFIATLDCDLGLDLEITDSNEEAITQLIPAIQSMQSRFDDVISEIISERILHEIHMFHLQRVSNPAHS